MNNILLYPTITGIAILNPQAGVLEYYIQKILRAIGENDNGIIWYLCKEIDLPTNKNRCVIIANRKVPLNRKLIYGECNIKTKEIWISTAAIATAPNKSMLSNITMRKGSLSLLEKVIIDEFTHIKTGRDHGDPKYDYYYDRYINMYKYGCAVKICG